MFLFYVLSFFKKGDTIQGGKLFKGGHYLRKYGILTFEFLFQDFDKADVDKKEGSKDKKEETKEREFQLSYIAAPKKTLNLINVPAKRDWVSKAEDLIKSDKNTKKESRKVRKKRLWLERKNNNGNLIRKNQARYVGDWEYLPDLCLELIFQYLTFEVSQRKCFFLLTKLF